MTRVNQIDINCDMGELDEVEDALFMPYISSCNISCGAHSGTPEKIGATMEQAVRHQLKIGAHPSYPDPAHFGRQSMNISRRELRRSIQEQLTFLADLAARYDATLHHVKAHGALYNDLAKDAQKLEDFVDWVKDFDPGLKIYGLALPGLKERVEARGIHFVGEAFMDRQYTAELTLVSRKKTGAVFQQLDLVLSQVDHLLNQKVPTEDGQLLPLHWETLCLHSDTPEAATWCPLIHQHIKNKGIAIA